MRSEPVVGRMLQVEAPGRRLREWAVRSQRSGVTARLRFAALLSLGLHGWLILTGQFRMSYDAYVHIFFADHYLRDWWSLWEPRWYTGFEVTSYPPLAHQSVALLGGIIGVENAFALLLGALLLAYVPVVYRFSRIFTGPSAAGFAAVGAALLPSFFLTAHIFGQLPTLFSGLLTLLAAVALDGFLKKGSALSGLLGVSLVAAAMAGHHATLLFQPWVFGAVLLGVLLKKGQNRALVLLRFAGFTLCAGLAALAVVWPFWEWQRSYQMQTPIDHLSRHNFIRDPFALAILFLPVYGLLVPFIPCALWMGRRKRFWGLGLSFALLFLLGLGGTTPLPRLFFGAGWSWLTYDRFAYWASLLLLPFLGAALALLWRNRILRKTWPLAVGAGGLVAIVVGLSNSWLPTQPDPLDMQPVVEYLEQPAHAGYRYITLGFGDQLASLSRLTRATTIDGSYHTARGLPELRASGIGQIDTAYWLPGGLDALDPILQKSGARGVRWAFVNLRLYDPVMERNGWRPVTRLANGVEVWENPAAGPPPPVEALQESPWKIFSWGVFPVAALFLSAGLSLPLFFPRIGARVLAAVQAALIALLPLGLSMWYYRRLVPIEHPRLYFTYSDALFFLVDGLALAAVLLWLARRLPLHPGDRSPAQPTAVAPSAASTWSNLSLQVAGVLPAWKSLREDGALPATKQSPLPILQVLSHPDAWLLSLCLLASLSVAWSIEPRTSLYISLHLWLCYATYRMLRDTPYAWRWFALGCCAALAVQGLLGTAQFASQSTAFYPVAGLDWPGRLDASLRGASVVQLEDGARWLRAYGAFPHPNLLGGFTLVALGSLLALVLLSSGPLALPVMLFNGGLALLALTFSRGAWLGAGLAAGWLLLRRRSLPRGRFLVLAATGLAALAMLAAWLHPLVLPRLGQGEVQTEQASNTTRAWLVERTMELVQERPLLGWGIGSFSLALSRHVPEFYDIEPVHSVALLALSELGVVGLLLAIGFGLAVLKTIYRSRKPGEVVFSAALLGLLATGLFDHYLWTLAPGRMLFAALLGLWAGQARAYGHPG